MKAMRMELDVGVRKRWGGGTITVFRLNNLLWQRGVLLAWVPGLRSWNPVP